VIFFGVVSYGRQLWLGKNIFVLPSCKTATVPHNDDGHDCASAFDMTISLLTVASQAHGQSIQIVAFSGPWRPGLGSTQSAYAVMNF
jgi:hypothetical protein